MQKQDLQQISDLLDEKLDEKFKENNKKIFKKIDKVDKKIETVLKTTKEGFDENTKDHQIINNRFDKVEERLKKVENKNNKIYKSICSYTDNELAELQFNMDKVKYIHINEWDNLPPAHEISKELVKRELKKSKAQ